MQKVHGEILGFDIILNKYLLENMSKEELSSVNRELISHLSEIGIKDAFYYEPGNPAWYWSKDNIRIGLCNLETYQKGINKEEFHGINVVNQAILDNWSWGNKTIRNTYFINYCIRKGLENVHIKYTEEDLRIFREQSKSEKIPNTKYWDVYEAMDKSLYFNFRHSISKTVGADDAYLVKAHSQDDVLCKNYRDFIKASELSIVVASGETGVKLLHIIYPELKSKLKFCGEPIFLEKILYISIPHPSRISYAEITNCVNKIAEVMKK